VIGRSPGDSAACDLAAALQATDLAIATAESRTGGQLRPNLRATPISDRISSAGSSFIRSMPNAKCWGLAAASRSDARPLPPK